MPFMGCFAFGKGCCPSEQIGTNAQNTRKMNTTGVEAVISHGSTLGEPSQEYSLGLGLQNSILSQYNWI